MNRFINIILRSLPNFLWPVRLLIIKLAIKKIGKNVKVSYNSIFTNFEGIEIRDDVFIGSNFYCSVEKGLVINDRVMFGSNCSVIGGDHSYNIMDQNMRFSVKKGNNNKIIVEHDAWIGHGTTLLKNSFVSEGAIIGAGSLVNRKLLPYSVYAGNPVKFIKPRFASLQELECYLETMKRNYQFDSKYNKDELKKIYSTNG